LQPKQDDSGAKTIPYRYFRASHQTAKFKNFFLEENKQEQRKLPKAVREFGTYITANRAFILNYGDRYRHGETISTGFVESAINQVLSKRFVKRQQMRWTDRGAHLLLQVRAHVLNEDWRSTLSRW
jgi:hypothetical protein